MSHDPILDSIDVIAHRTLVFILISIFQAIVFGWFVLCVYGGLDFDNFIPWIENRSDRTLAIFVVLFLLFGTSSTAMIYLIIGNWWKKRINVPHYRGARLERNGD